MKDENKSVPFSGIFIGAGSNEGDREDNMRRALSALEAVPGADLGAISSLYRTSPVGYNDQRDFYNGVVEMSTSLSPRELLLRLKEIERALGRKESGVRWGPRLIDLDILLWGGRVIREADLIIPHPEMHRRRFVLAPLAEISPEARHPLLDKTAEELLAILTDDGGVTRIGDWTR